MQKDSLTARLKLHSDSGYASFTAKLIPGMESDRILGVRIPLLRSIARAAAGTTEAKKFLTSLPHLYHDENNLHAALLMYEKLDTEELLLRIEQFLPYIDNWSTCDMLKPPQFAFDQAHVYGKITKWIRSPHTYTARFAVTSLIYFFLGENYRFEQSELCAAHQSSEYYVNMALSWYFAEGLAKRPDDFLPYFMQRRIENPWVFAKALQKARESLKITDEQKILLKKLSKKKL